MGALNVIVYVLLYLHRSKYELVCKLSLDNDFLLGGESLYSSVLDNKGFKFCVFLIQVLH